MKNLYNRTEVERFEIYAILGQERLNKKADEIYNKIYISGDYMNRSTRDELEIILSEIQEYRDEKEVETFVKQQQQEQQQQEESNMKKEVILQGDKGVRGTGLAISRNYERAENRVEAAKAVGVDIESLEALKEKLNRAAARARLYSKQEKEDTATISWEEYIKEGDLIIKYIQRVEAAADDLRYSVEVEEMINRVRVRKAEVEDIVEEDQRAYNRTVEGKTPEQIGEEYKARVRRMSEDNEGKTAEQLVQELKVLEEAHEVRATDEAWSPERTYITRKVLERLEHDGINDIEQDTFTKALSNMNLQELRVLEAVLEDTPLEV